LYCLWLCQRVCHYTKSNNHCWVGSIHHCRNSCRQLVEIGMAYHYRVGDPCWIKESPSSDMSSYYCQVGIYIVNRRWYIDHALIRYCILQSIALFTCLISRTFLANEQHFSLTTNQRIVLSVMTF
jgi:hypothetical protein